MASDMDGDSADGRWLTYAELAEIRGITTRSATRMAFRAKWRRQAANDGTARVFVPQSALHGKPSGDDTGKALVDMAAAMGGLQAELERAGARADRAEARADALRERLEALLVEQRLEADHARRQVQEAQEAAEALRAELAADRARADQADAALREAQERLDALARSAQPRLLRGRLARLLPWRRVEW